MSDCIPNSALLDMLNALQDNYYTHLKVGLFTNNISVTPETKLSDLVQPVGSWYALADTSANDAYYDQALGGVSVSIPSVQFDYSGSDASETIHGAFLVGGSTYFVDDSLMGCKNFGTPVEMSQVGDSIVAEINLNIQSVPQLA